QHHLVARLMSTQVNEIIQRTNLRNADLLTRLFAWFCAARGWLPIFFITSVCGTCLCRQRLRLQQAKIRMQSLLEPVTILTFPACHTRCISLLTQYGFRQNECKTQLADSPTPLQQ